MVEVKKQDINKALEYIDRNGLPEQVKNLRIKYELITDEKKYPVRYVYAVAVHLADGSEISAEAINADQAKSALEGLGFTIQNKEQEKYELTITADHITSTDDRFTMDDLNLGDNYRPLKAFYKKADGTIINRNYSKGEKRISNQTLPRIAFQVFEKQIAALSVEEKENFPICKYKPTSETICGIYSSEEDIKKQRNTFEYSVYTYDNGRKFVIYSWNIFTTLIFAQECLKRFGEPGDQFVLIYRDKDITETSSGSGNGGSMANAETDGDSGSTGDIQPKPYQIPYSYTLLESRNLIFRGAPGTGKSFLARSIAADIVSNGYYDSYASLTEAQKQQIEFVQFHPSYDYTDFVEGLRPKINADGSMGFELQDGIFKRFVLRARKNYEDSFKSRETIQKEISVQDAMADFFAGIELDKTTFKTINGNEFTISSIDDQHINISIPGNATVKRLAISVDEIRQLLESGKKFEKIKDITAFFGKTFATQAYSYDFVLCKEIQRRKKKNSRVTVRTEEVKNYIFIIDEINRGEISKIFGELFFAIDPGYRGRAGEISTQYSNLHINPNDKFYIPKNVYIIGTMNDIDRSVDSFDFAMRRRFRFIELKANEQTEMLSSLEDEKLKSEAIRRMTALNEEIVKVEDLNENYQIGAAYFLKLKSLTFDQLWTDYLQPLLEEYIHGMYDEDGIMSRFAKAYGYPDNPT